MSKVYSVVITGQNAGQFVQNVLHYQSSESGSFDAYTWAEDVVEAWYVNMKASFLALLSPDYSMLSIRGRRVSTPGGPTYIKLTSGDVGAHLGDTETAGLSAEARFPVVIGGKNVTGKFFVPGVPEGVWLLGQMAGAYTTLLQTFSGNLLNPLSGSISASNYDFGIWRSPKSGPPAVVEAFTAATHAVVGPNPVNLKRRNMPI